MSYIDKVDQVAKADAAGIKEKDAAYGGSWQKRGGVGAFMMLARKWDRIENAVEKHGWDVFVTIIDDIRDENTLDDIRDLRRYLNLVEAEILDRIDLKEKERAVDNFRVGGTTALEITHGDVGLTPHSGRCEDVGCPGETAAKWLSPEGQRLAGLSPEGQRLAGETSRARRAYNGGQDYPTDVGPSIGDAQ